MIRVPHFLRGNKGGETPQLAAWVDTETREVRIDELTVKHVLRFGWVAWQRTYAPGKWTELTWCRFTDPTGFWDFILPVVRSHTRLFLFAHNWAFDAPVLGVFTQLPARGWTLKHAVIESPPVILSWRRFDRSLVMLDTLNWWRTSLASLGESVGTPKLKMPRATSSRKRWDVYCRNDVTVIHHAMRSWWDFLKTYDLGGFASTLAGQAFRAYRHRFMRVPILVDANPRALALARESYLGGRVEAYRIGRVKGPVYALDVNSMYPYVMREREYPTVLRLHCRNPAPAELRRWLSSKCVIARCRLESRLPTYGIRLGDKLVFPVGRFDAVLTTPDLFRALQFGHLKDCSEAAVYDRARIFESFVDELYALRLKAQARGDKVSVHLLKILMNSLYGKFGQRGGVWQKVGDTADLSVRSWLDYDLESGTLDRMRQLAGIVQRRETDPESYSSHPAIAAHVTAYARAYLWSLVDRAARGNVIYVDTDSLFVNEVGFRRLRRRVHATDLGALKVEHKWPWVEILGAKDYRTPDTRKVKGVRSNARWLSPNSVEQEQWSSLAGLLATGTLESPTTKTVRKVLSRTYAKGTVAPSGAVSPLSLSAWSEPGSD